MASAVGDWIATAGIRMPVLILIHEETMDEVGPVWMARSIMTGHVSAGSDPARARACLLRTVAGSFELAARHGKTYAQWFADQRPAEPRYVEEYFQCASEVGRDVEWSSTRGNIAMAPA
jgi:hypothetical protein